MHVIRRTSTALASAVVALLLVPGVATAEVRATVTSPGRDAVVTEPVDLDVTVTRDLLDAEIRSVSIRLSPDGSRRAADTTAVVLSCVTGCGSERSTWSGPSYAPTTGVPFSSSGPVCNGRWHLQPSVDGGAFTSGVTVTVAADPSPARAVTSSADGDAITVRWEAAPEPDVAAYRVERRVDGGSWRTVATVDAGQTDLTRRGLVGGRYEHRVVTLRPDGFVGGAPAAPCADRDHDLAATSSTTHATVATKPSPSASPSPGGSATPSPRPSSSPQPGTGGDPSDGGSDEPGDGSSPDPSASPSDGATAPGDEPSPGATQGAGGPAPRIGAPPSARREGPRLGAPSLPSQPNASREPVYFGEDDPFSEELDYDGADAIAGEDPGTRTVTERVAGGVEIFTERFVEPERILRPVAAGLIALTLGMHLRRWQRDGR